MEKTLASYIDTFILGVLNRPSVAKLSTKQKNAIEQQLRKHFETLTIETLLHRLDEEKLEEVRKASKKKGSKAMEETLQQYASSIPGFAEDLHKRFEREFTVLMANL